MGGTAATAGRCWRVPLLPSPMTRPRKTTSILCCRMRSTRRQRHQTQSLLRRDPMSMRLLGYALPRPLKSPGFHSSWCSGSTRSYRCRGRRRRSA